MRNKRTGKRRRCGSVSILRDSCNVCVAHFAQSIGAIEPLEPRRLLSTTWYVDAAASGTSHDGTSWTSAYTDLQQALASGVSGDAIHVAQGTYKPTSTTDRTISFQLKTGVEIDGGYAGSTSPTPDARDVTAYPTVLSGELGNPAYYSDNSPHVVIGSGTDATAVLDGVTITAGNANSGGVNGRFGGGMLNVSGSPTLRDCTFTNNSADNGGAIYNEHASPTLTNCIFEGNSGGDGGAIYNYDSSSPMLINCVFSGNLAGVAGGAIFNRDSSPLLNNCTLAGNSTGVEGIGGEIYNLNFYKSSNPVLTNCILWGNSSPDGLQSGGMTITYSDVQNGFTGTGNIDADPRFVRNPDPGADNTWGTADDDYGDLRLEAYSPVVDAADNSALPSGTSTDLAGADRFQDVPTTPDTGSGIAPIADMGAYEAKAAFSVGIGGPYCVIRNQSVTLQAQGASDVRRAISYAWDFDHDGRFDDATGPTPVFNATENLGTIPIAVELTDTAGAWITATTTLTIAPSVVYVDGSVSGPIHDGLSWAGAYVDLQQALASTVNGQRIDVAQGTYTPTTGTDRDAAFHLVSGASIYGGYAGAQATDPNRRDVTSYPTVLSGEIGDASNVADNSNHVLIADEVGAGTVLDGLTIQSGYAAALLNQGGTGGGIFMHAASPTIRNCTFQQNRAAGNSGTFGTGGAIYMTGESAPMISDCAFLNNFADQYGAILVTRSSPTLIGCRFTGNRAQVDGGAIGIFNSSKLTLDQSTFDANTSGGEGNALYNSSSSLVLTGCSFTGNTSPNSSSIGGAIYSGGARSSLELNGCDFIRNRAGSGGAIYNISAILHATHCRFLGNTAGFGGAIRNDSGGANLLDCIFAGNEMSAIYAQNTDLTLTNCTFAGNVNGNDFPPTILQFSDPSSAPRITNCIIWGNSTDLPVSKDGFTVSTAPIVTHSDVQGGYAGAANIQDDPRFIRNPDPGEDGAWGTADDDYGDLRLRSYSPVVDAGNNAAVPTGITSDLDGNDRFQDVPTTPDSGDGTAPIVDMGAYEAVPALAVYAGDPYILVQNHSISLSALGASDAAGPLQYEWDFDDDGQFDDATGPAANFSDSSTVGTYPIAVRLTDAQGHSVISSTTLTVLPAVLYVDGSVSGPVHDGSSWNSAFSDLQSALLPAIAGQRIDIAQGTYRPTASSDRTISFRLKAGVSIYGGYAGQAAGDPNARDVSAYRTILSGDIGAAGDNADNSFHVLDANETDATALMDGFTITAGNANGSETNQDKGGGMLILSGSPTMNDCTFNANSASQGGGAIENNAASPTLTNCIFIGNSGGAHASIDNEVQSSPNLTDCVFTSNTGFNGGAMYSYSSSPILTRCSFSGNSATAVGGAIYDRDTVSSLTDCIFNNNSGREGGAMFQEGISHATLLRCIFSGNSAQQGGAVYYRSGLDATDCIFSGNHAIYQGGALFDYDSVGIMTNCTLSGNSAGTGGAIYNANIYSTPRFVNCILWNNFASTDDEISGGKTTITYSDFQGGYAGAGNIDADPLFYRNPSAGADGSWGTADDDYGDLHLQPGSPCIDAGSNAAVPSDVTTDLGGNPRIIDFPGVHDPGAIVDMGAYEAFDLDGMHLTAGEHLVLPAGHHVFSASGLIIDPGATLDIKDDSLIINYPGASSRLGSWDSSTGQYNGLTGQIQSGAIFSSLAQPRQTTLGIAAASNLFGISGSQTATWGGQTVGSIDVLIKFTYVGDANLDGKVNIDDYGRIDANVGQSGSVFGWYAGDFNLDGKINIDDYGLIDSIIGAQGPVL